MVTGTSMTEQDLVKIRGALEKATLTDALSAMGEVLARLGYVRLDLPKCARCGQPLVVPQQRDFVELEEGKVCTLCLGGS